MTTVNAINTVATQSVYVSTLGSDTLGNGTQSNPYRTIVKAQTVIAALGTASNTNQFTVVIDSGTYSETGLTVRPYINWVGSLNGVFISNNTAITLNSSWNGTTLSTGIFSASNVTITNSTAFTLDSTGITTFGGNFYFSNFTTQGTTTFKAGSASHNIQFNLLNNVNLCYVSGAFTLDGVTVEAYPFHTICSGGGSFNILSTNKQGTIISNGNLFIQGPNMTTTASNGVSASFYTGNIVTFGTLNASAGQAIAIDRDATTFQATPVSHYSGTVNDILIAPVINNYTDDIVTSDNLLPFETFIADNAALVTYTLPTITNINDTYQILGKGAGLFKVAQNAGQSIIYGNTTTTTGTGGSLSSTNIGDVLTIKCVVANTTFMVVNSVGNFTVV